MFSQWRVLLAVWECRRVWGAAWTWGLCHFLAPSKASFQPGGLQTPKGSQWNMPCTNLLCTPSHAGAGRAESQGWPSALNQRTGCGYFAKLQVLRKDWVCPCTEGCVPPQHRVLEQLRQLSTGLFFRLTPCRVQREWCWSSSCPAPPAALQAVSHRGSLHSSGKHTQQQSLSFCIHSFHTESWGLFLPRVLLGLFFFLILFFSPF